MRRGRALARAASGQPIRLTGRQIPHASLPGLADFLPSGPQAQQSRGLTKRAMTPEEALVVDIASLLSGGRRSDSAGSPASSPPSRRRTAAILNSLAAVPWESPAAGTQRYLLHPAAVAVAVALPRSALLSVTPLLTPQATANLLRAVPQEASAAVVEGLLSSPPEVLRCSPGVLFWAVMRSLETDEQGSARALLAHWKGDTGGEMHALPWDAVRLLFTHRAVRGDFNALHVLQDYVSSRPRAALCHRDALLGRVLHALTHQLTHTVPPTGLRPSDWGRLTLDLGARGRSDMPSVAQLGTPRDPASVRTTPISAHMCTNTLSQHSAQVLAAADALFGSISQQALADGVLPSAWSTIDPP
jgi:hypothetical protein